MIDHPNSSPPLKETSFTFKRYEKKYLLSPEKYCRFISKAVPHLLPDAYHRSLVCSIYYDSSSFDLIRHSVEGPVYKEKLRVRSYGIPSKDGEVFVELKKKFKGVVYKRRISTSAIEAEAWLSGSAPAPKDTQISREIDWFIRSGNYSPKAFIACDRVSWYDKDVPDLRITFDENIRFRRSDLHLYCSDHGESILPEGYRLMEIKIPGAAPLWLSSLLSTEDIFPSSFSKYGTCYKEELLPENFPHPENLK